MPPKPTRSERRAAAARRLADSADSADSAGNEAEVEGKEVGDGSGAGANADLDAADVTKARRRSKANWDDDEVDPGETTYQRAQPGPDPVPEWVITSGDARQSDVGPLKSGKEAVVHLVERSHLGRHNLLAAKRYKGVEDRQFRNDARYRSGRSTGDRRADLAMKKGTRRGMSFRAREWSANEFDLLGRLWSAGAPVPYPVQLFGTEVMMEYLGDDEAAAPRLAAADLDRDEMHAAFDMVVEAMHSMAALGIAHGDLSPYNLLWWQDRVWVIDLPQAVDALRASDGRELLTRDVHTVCAWFERKGVAVDEGPLMDDLVASLLSGA